jgi:hypothetical protein
MLFRYSPRHLCTTDRDLCRRESADHSMMMRSLCCVWNVEEKKEPAPTQVDGRQIPVKSTTFLFRCVCSTWSRLSRTTFLRNVTFHI